MASAVDGATPDTISHPARARIRHAPDARARPAPYTGSKFAACSLGAEMRILIADDQARVRRALRILLTQQPGLQVVGEAAEGGRLLAQAEASSPDVILLEWELPGLAQAGGLPALRALCPSAHILVLGSRPGARQAARSAGAGAFVSKGDPPERLLAALSECDTITA